MFCQASSISWPSCRLQTLEFCQVYQTLFHTSSHSFPSPKPPSTHWLKLDLLRTCVSALSLILCQSNRFSLSKTSILLCFASWIQKLYTLLLFSLPLLFHLEYLSFFRVSHPKNWVYVKGNYTQNSIRLHIDQCCCFPRIHLLSHFLQQWDIGLRYLNHQLSHAFLT